SSDQNPLPGQECGKPILLVPEHNFAERTGFQDADAGLRKANVMNIENAAYYEYASPYRDFSNALPGEPIGTLVPSITPDASRFIRLTTTSTTDITYQSMVRNWLAFYKDDLLNCRLIPSFTVGESTTGYDHSPGFIFLRDNVFGEGAPALNTNCIVASNDIVKMTDNGPNNACNKRYTDPQGLDPYVDFGASISQSLTAESSRIISATWLSGELYHELIGGVEADRLDIVADAVTYPATHQTFPRLVRTSRSSANPEIMFTFTTGGSSGSTKEGWVYSVKCPSKSQRRIESFYPLSGPPGQRLTVEAYNIDPVNDRFYFNGVSADISQIGSHTFTVDVPLSIRTPVYLVVGPGNANFGEYASSDVPFVPIFTIYFTPQKVARDASRPKCNALRCTTLEEGTPNYTHFRWYRILSGQATLINSGGQHFVEMTNSGRGVFQLDGLSGQYLHVSGKGQYLIKNWLSDPLYASKRIELWQDPGDISGRTLSVGGGTQLEGRVVDIDVPGSYWVYDINNPRDPIFPLPTASVINISAEEVAPCGLEFDGTAGLSMSGKSSLVSVGTSDFSFQVKFSFKKKSDP
ncbi:hypothetical protein WDZ92_34925, partial [Nostoc sp. NIES-2111]